MPVQADLFGRMVDRSELVNGSRTITAHFGRSPSNTDATASPSAWKSRPIFNHVEPQRDPCPGEKDGLSEIEELSCSGAPSTTDILPVECCEDHRAFATSVDVL